MNLLGRRPKRQKNPAARTYGGTKTIHRTGALDVETHNGRVVSVWFRCQVLPFRQTEVGDDRSKEMGRMYDGMHDGMTFGIDAVDLVDLRS